MKPIRFLFAFAFSAGLPSLVGAADPASPVTVALTLNDGTSRTAERGGPLVLRGDVVLSGESLEGVTVGPATPTIVIKDGTGAPLNWPLRRVGGQTGPATLTAKQESVRFSWLLPAEGTAMLPSGLFTATLSFAGQTSSPLAFELTDAPASTSPQDRIRRAVLKSEAAALSGDTVAALAAVQLTDPPWEKSLPLLLQAARVYELRREFKAMLATTGKALDVYRQDTGSASKGDEPPSYLRQLQTRALNGLLQPPPGGFPKMPPDGKSPRQP